MGWLLLVAYPHVLFALLVSSQEECAALAHFTKQHFDGAVMVCARTWEV